MIRNPYSSPRRGTTAVEGAFVYPVAFGFMLALVVGALGVFRFQEVAFLAREAARYASTHGAQYRQDAKLGVGTPSDWSSDIYANAIAPKVVDLDAAKLSYTVTWPNVVNQPAKSDNWPGSSVTVTVSYQWFPELFLAGPLTLTRTSTMPITN